MPTTSFSTPTAREGLPRPASSAPAPTSAPRDTFFTTPPTLSLPKGGGAIRGIGEKFSANPVTGTGSMSVPIGTAPGRGGFGPQLALTYDSGAGNGLFGLGWNLSVPTITRKTDRGLPRYLDVEESDVFILAGLEDLVPVLDGTGHRTMPALCTVYGQTYLIQRYRPRVEGSFALIERWMVDGNPASTFWRTISRDNITTWYGRTPDSRVVDPDDGARVFQWMICQTYDDKGNVVVYDYAREDGNGAVRSSVEEGNRSEAQRTANCYLKNIRYGNLKPYLPTLEEGGTVWVTPDSVAGQSWMFQVVFDYGDHDERFPTPARARSWAVRADPFSSYRAGFEVRTYRLCRRVLMFHHFPGEAGVGSDCLVRSTDFEYDEPDRPRDPTKRGYTVLRAVVHRAYQRRTPTAGEYESRQLPPVTFAYSEARVNPTVQTIPPNQIENLPVGTQGSGYQWLDLDGEGLSGVLTEQAGAWYYKPNIGGGRFGPMRVVARKPAMAALGSGRQQFMDLAGDGAIDLVDFSGPTPGFHERDPDEGWTRLVPFASLPNIDWDDPNLRFVDLTGDGRADALITEEDVFTWYPSLEERGFGTAERTRQAGDDEDLGPRLVFADGTQTIFLADMCGDGLTDLVRVRNGEVCHWPNLGYGRFGRKVTLGNSPRFDYADVFDPRRVRLADIDGSGPADVIYLGGDGARLYFNRSGNSLSDPLLVDLPVATENLGAVQVADLLGNGTACLVWNSHLPADERHPVRYIDLMAGREDAAEHGVQGKPHLLSRVDNNLGGSTEIEYTPSTKHYVQDKAAGAPWITRLPFPVHCVSKVTVRDKWRGTAFSSTYTYHHGYFDGVEREFRGFGRVEQVDVEDYGTFAKGNSSSPYVTDDRTLYQPPVKTVTWYHTGAALDRGRILTQFEAEYFPARFTLQGGFKEKTLSEPELPRDLSADEWREALRACKGMTLRQEVYELDVDDLSAMPSRHTPVRLFSVATHNCHIERLQARGDNPHAVFLVTESEALTYHYDLALPKDGGGIEPDPRVAHTLNLRRDEYGNPQQSVAVGYGRFATSLPAGVPATVPRANLIAQVQAEQHVAYTETRYTTDVTVPAPGIGAQRAIRHRRLRLPCDVRTYEITGLSKPVSGYLDLAELRRHALCEDATYPPVVPAHSQPISLTPLEYHQQPQSPGPHRRIVEHVRSLFFQDEDGIAQPNAPHPFGQHGPRGLKYEDYKLALTDALLNAVFQQRDANTGLVVDDKLGWRLEDTGAAVRTLLDSAATSGYIPGLQIAPSLSGQYWIRSGRAGFAADAAAHFFLPCRYTDAFGNLSTLAYDGRDLFVESSTDARANTMRVQRFDYRVLVPREIVDPNGNHTEVAFDILGLVAATATKGKRLGNAWEGDDLSGFDLALCNPPPADVRTFCTARILDTARAESWLGRATARFVYHFGNVTGWGDRMAGACAIQRERHQNMVDIDPLHDKPLQVSLECSDGTGNVLMRKVQAEPETANGPLRWIVNGLTVLNNKGKPVKQYEPAFSVNFGCELPQANGVTTVMYYDAVGRLMRTELPDGTLSRVEFSPWHVRTFDQNDTVLESRWCRERLTASERGVDPLTADVEEERRANRAPAHDKRAARLAARHAATPALTILDSLGREVIAIAHNREPEDSPQWANTALIDRPWRDIFALTHTRLDAEGKPLWIRDGRGNLVMQYIAPSKANSGPSDAMPAGAAPCYDIAGNLLFQHSMDAGDRWMLADAAGKPMLAWDYNERTTDTGATVAERRLFHTRYDALQRPTERWLRVNSDARALVEAFDYVDTADLGTAALLTAAQGNNLVSHAVRHYDPSGLATVERVDFKGAEEAITRTLVTDVTAPIVDWNVANRPALLEADVFHHITEYDALGRPATLYNWHREIAGQPGYSNRVAVYVPKYNRRGALESETLHVRAAKQPGPNGRPAFVADPDAERNVQAIKNVTWNAKGQKLTLELGNGTITRYTYDPETFRLTHLYTRRDGRFTGDCAGDPDEARPPRPCGVQNLHYSYDPVGNIAHIQDDAQDTVWFGNQQVEPSSDYVYDALYRLIEAAGRENAIAVAPPRHPEGPWPTGSFPSPNATHRYTQRYHYDQVGNVQQMEHFAPGFPGQPASSWTRHYTVQSDSNRLDRTWYNSDTANAVTYRHDPHGSMLNLDRTAPGLDIRWDWRDMIRALDLQGGGSAYYSYDADKQRTRKRLVRNSGATEDRIYLSGYELYRRRDPQGVVVEEIESLHLFEGEQRVLLVDDVLLAQSGSQPGPNGLRVKEQTLFRYQYGNHLGSVGTELDAAAQLISHEEFHPCGTSAYRLVDSAKEAPAKRYRYTGMERDEESGLSYHHRRFLLSSLARWISADPSGTMDGYNLYSYAHDSPTREIDKSGKQAVDPDIDSESRGGGLPTTAAEARALSAYFYGRGDIQTSKFFQGLGHQMGVAEGLASARKIREEGSRASNVALAVLLSAPVVVALAIEGGPAVVALSARAAPLATDPRVALGMALMYGFLAPPGAPDLPTPADDTGRAVKVASAGFLATMLRRMRGKGGLPAAAAFAKFFQASVERLVTGKMQLPRAEAERVVRELAEAATAGSLNSAAAVERRIVELMKLSTEMAEEQGFQNAIAGSSNRALGNRAHAYLRVAVEALDLELRSRSIQGERLGVLAEMFVKTGGEWVFQGRIKGSTGLDAVFFSQGGILKGLDLKTGRLLSEAELKPYRAAWNLTAETLVQVLGRGSR